MTLRLEIEDAVATLTIDRPSKRNAMSFEMWSAIPGLLDKVAEDDAVRALVIRGTDHFSAGADISEFATLRSDAEGAERYGAAVLAGERAIAGLPKPTIAAITGVCVGGGCEIALACDMRVAAPDARFGITPAKLGIVYNFTSTKQLVDVVGPAWARQVLFTADIIDADTALRIGLVNELTEDPVARAVELATTMASRAQVSLRGAKTIITKITEGEHEDDEVRALYTESVQSPDYAEGVAAFLEKRTPRF
ncbi:enoyl-CoA hydratase/isomerase family protein [Actinophytocola algeriensis]|uniref:Enoyl-CoA hydratase/carnithine racemase n=1 Tax=Actinophytocola algeriensis TaxID=1768010 RepID=A0A7W7QCU9_9PSEU|nr:enoyl-CoA hydratase-related protein [Actinophytocola algeriensis]MBB4911215.1 enoyl-CoA hydratase/carnithine racemase [Actinophytocola algeriensis]MBE1479154.1 enoyl-CoA hydratase/carnithine racemase [Actinophytocola algeriensis]